MPVRRTAVITGAASGLGAALTRLLAVEGWSLALVDLPESAATLKRIAPASPGGASTALVAPFDVRDAAGWQTLHDRLRAAWPALDLLVNAAGVGATGEVGQLPDAQWRRVIDTNLVGTALGCETFLPWLREHPSGARVVNVASISGLLGIPSMAAYSASKAGVIALLSSSMPVLGLVVVTARKSSAAPAPTRAGVLGMARMTRWEEPSQDWRSAREMPAAMER
jgi:NAD(P)-dependent dehydrogenase (short-subunit alcohol dehydrogenase family)